MSTDDDRIAYLAGQPNDELSDHERESLDELRLLLAAPAVWAEPPPNLEDAIVAALEHEAHARTPPAPRRRSPTPRRLMPHRALGLAGLAATALAAILIALAPSRGQAPQRFAMIVSGTPLAPSAHGHATLTKTASGWDIQLRTRGLPHLAHGRYYEAWLSNRAGVLVPVGTFNDARAVTLWAGVPPNQFPTLTVTVQPVGSTTPSPGMRVLIGTIRR